MNAVAEKLPETNPWARWEAALLGEPLDLGARGDPPWGYYRFPPSKTRPNAKQEAVAVWGDVQDGSLQCVRNVYGDGDGMTAMQIDEMFSHEHYAIPFELYLAVTDRNEPWPEIYTTRLRTKDILNGVVWSEAWARAQLAADVETHDEAGNPREVIGGNNPPPDLTPAEALGARINCVAVALASFLTSIGGQPRNKPEADSVANYATKFKEFSTEATATHKIAKEPHLAAGRAVDGEFFPIRDKAEACRKKALAIADTWMNAEKARLNEEARKVNEAAREAARKQAMVAGEPPAPIQEVVAAPVKIGTGRTVSQRTRKVWAVTDFPAFLAYLAKMEPPNADLVACCELLAHRLGAAGVIAPGITLTEKASAQ